MEHGLQDKITSMGYWRVNLRPLKDIATKLTMAECHDVVSRSSVSLRGWDYPHIQRNQNNGGYANVGEYAENWCDWRVHSEFWRMYRSSQFLHYRALWEDVDINDNSNRPSGPVLSVLGTIYTITEIIEFASRLNQNGLYNDGVHANIGLFNTKGRQLWIGEASRIPFFEEKRTDASKLEFERNINPNDLRSNPMAESRSILLELFDHFGWNPVDTSIQSDQERFYNKQW